MSKKPLAVALATATIIALPAGDALASDVLGSPLQDLAQTTGPCEAAAGCAYVQEKLPGDLATVAPYSGVVVRWRVRGAGTFSVFAASYAADDTIVRRAGGQPEQVTSSEDVATYTTRFPIGAGQVVGLAMTHASTVRSGETQGADLDTWGPAPAEGAATLATGPRDVAGEMAYNVAIERPAARHRRHERSGRREGASCAKRIPGAARRGAAVHAPRGGPSDADLRALPRLAARRRALPPRASRRHDRTQRWRRAGRDSPPSALRRPRARARALSPGDPSGRRRGQPGHARHRALPRGVKLELAPQTPQLYR